MTDYNSMKADEYAQRQGVMDDMDNAIDEMIDVVLSEVPEWLFDGEAIIGVAARNEAIRRVAKARRERSEP